MVHLGLLPRLLGIRVYWLCAVLGLGTLLLVYWMLDTSGEYWIWDMPVLG